jgi:inward rectifier potassium channel
MPKTRKYPSVKYIGQTLTWHTYYYKFLDLPVWSFVILLFLTFIGINFLFAFIYLETNSLQAALPLNFSDHLFFSVQTLVTWGFTDVKLTELGRYISILEIFSGMLFMGTVTGIIFYKFTRTKSPFVWSSPIVLYQDKGKKFLQVRLTNIIGNEVINVNAKLFLERTTITKSGRPLRTLINLPLEVEHIPIAAFSRILSHPITKSSPINSWLSGKAAPNDSLIGFIHGADITIGKEVYNYTRWNQQDLVKGEFENIVLKHEVRSDSRVHATIDLTKIDEVVLLKE